MGDHVEELESSANPRFEVLDGFNRVQTAVGSYVIALNAGDVYETGDVAEIEGLDKNDYVQRTEKPATRVRPDGHDLLPGADVRDASYVNDLAYVDAVEPRARRARTAAAAPATGADS